MAKNNPDSTLKAKENWYVWMNNAWMNKKSEGYIKIKIPRLI